MMSKATFRSAPPGTLNRATSHAVLCAVLALPSIALAQATYPPEQPTYQQPSQPAPIVRHPPTSQQAPPAQQQQRTGNGPYVFPGVNGKQQHLSQWMDSHRNLPLEQQQRALSAEPGFHQLQPNEQARIHERLEQLNTMTPEQRQRMLARTEAMEKLSPPQRQQVRGALKDLGSLPEDRRRMVARTFRGLRDLSPTQQQACLNGAQLRSQFSEQERATLYNLLVVAPYLPPPPASPPRYTPAPLPPPQ